VTDSPRPNTTSASGGSIAVGGDFSGRIRQDNSVRNIVRNLRIGTGGPAVLIVAVIVLVVLIVGVRAIFGLVTGDEITADTKCRDYLAADTATRDEAVKRIALELNHPDAGHPWMVNNVDYSCGSGPDRTLRQVIAP